MQGGYNRSRGDDTADVMFRQFENLLRRVGGARLLTSAVGPGLSSTVSGGQISGFGGEAPIDIIETATEYQVLAELPGVSERDIDIQVSGDTLTIRANKQPPQQVQQALQRYEQRGGEGQGQGQRQGQGQGQGQDQSHIINLGRTYGPIQETIHLGQSVDRDRIQAEYSRGVLLLRLPKSSETQQRQKRIEVKAGSTT